MTDLEHDIIDSAFGRECDHCIQGSERMEKARELRKRILDLLSESEK